MYNVSVRQYKVGRNLDVDQTGDLVITGHRTCFGWVISNMAQSTLYIKLYNKATAPTVGTDTPTMTIPIAGGHESHLECVGGIDFSLGIGIGATTGVADDNTGAPGANEVVANILYV